MPTFDGSVVLKVPAQTKQHATLRLRGKGVERKQQRGDLLIDVDVRMPDIADAAFAEALRASDKLYTTPIREGLAL